ncbi:MAG: hypothetical protein QW057_00565 [Candidatus Bathyarchaeia archaeon]
MCSELALKAVDAERKALPAHKPAFDRFDLHPLDPGGERVANLG